jgi:sugar phosphate isomerase/epimerase
MKLAICVQTDEVPRPVPVALFSGRFAERARRAAEAGADGLEVMTVDPQALDPAAIRAALREHNLAVAAVGSGAVASITGLTLLHADPEVAAAAGQRLIDLIDFAAGIGAPLVTIGSFRGRLSSAGPGGRRRLAEALHNAAAQAAERGVRLAIEPANRYELDLVNNAAQGLAFLADVDHPAAGLLLDTFHVNIEEASWTEPFRVLLAAGVLWHVHVGDNNRLAPGRGLIDFPAIVGTLAKGGYDGFLSAELLAQPDGDTAACQTLAYLRPLVERYR